jgi:multimeric flavodoxin WrbA
VKLGPLTIGIVFKNGYINDKIMTRILIVNASPKPKSHTRKLLAIFEFFARRQGARVDIMNLAKEQILHHNGRLGRKIHTKPAWTRRIVFADGIIIGTPTYWFNVPGILKDFIDQLTFLEEEGFLLEGKVFGCIAYAPQGGGAGVASNLSLVASHMGMIQPPYGLLFDEGRGDAWVKKDLKLLADNMIQLIRLQKESKISWDYKKK